jgi:hypothetical protein
MLGGGGHLTCPHSPVGTQAFHGYGGIRLYGVTTEKITLLYIIVVVKLIIERVQLETASVV